MTHDAREVSAQGGEPIELYEFSIGVITYRYTSAQGNQVHDLQDFTAVPIERGEFEESSELAKNDITLTVAQDFFIAEQFNVAPPSQVILLSIYQKHAGETERVLAWSGRVLNCEWQGSSRALLTCESIYTSLRRPGLRRQYQRQCPHQLYGPRCGLANTSFAVAMTLTAVTGVTLQAPDLLLYATDHFAGGYLEFEESPGVIVRRAIRSNSADQMVVTHPIPGLESGTAVTMFFGCDHTVTTCVSKFNNLVNYGGFLYIPQKNPFGSNTVY